MGWAAEQYLPGATGNLGIMLVSSKKDLKTSLEVLAVLQWALSAILTSESSAFGRVTNSPGLPGIEGF